MLPLRRVCIEAIAAEEYDRWSGKKDTSIHQEKDIHDGGDLNVRYRTLRRHKFVLAYHIVHPTEVVGISITNVNGIVQQ